MLVAPAAWVRDSKTHRSPADQPLHRVSQVCRGEVCMAHRGRDVLVSDEFPAPTGKRSRPRPANTWKHVLARRALGVLLRQKGDFQGALAELRAAVAGHPDDAENRQTMGTVLMRLNDLNGAVQELHQAVHLNPFLSEARRTLAQALRRTGRSEEGGNQVCHRPSQRSSSATA